MFTKPNMFLGSGLEQRIPTPVTQLGNYFAPIQSRDDNKEINKKVDILEILRKANVDVKPLLSSLTANKEKLKESCMYLISTYSLN